MRVLLFLAAFGLCLQASALDTPEALVKRAETSAKNLQDVVLELRQNIPNLTSPVLFRQYFEILPRLKQLSVELKLEQIHPGGIENLGESMVSYGARWLDLSKDSLQTVKQHFDWMTPSTALRYLHQVEDDVFTLKGDEFQRFAVNLNYIVETSNVKFVKDPYIGQGYRDLLSLLAYEKLKVTPITDTQEHLYWLVSIKNQDSLSSYSNFLQEQVLAFTTNSQAEVTSTVTILNALMGYVNKNTFPVTDAVKSSIGYVTIEILDKSVINGWTLSSDVTNALVDSLSLSHLNNLADRLMSPSHVPAAAIYKQYLALVQKVIATLNSGKDQKKAAELGQKVYSKVAPLMLLEEGREGTYAVRSEKTKETWRFTLMQSSEGRMIAGLAREKDILPNFTFFNVEYDAHLGAFVASEAIVVNVGDKNFMIRFKFNDKGEVVIDSPMLISVGTLTGARIETYENLAVHTKVDATFIEGYFEGYTEINGKKMPVKLSLIRFNENTMGRITIGDAVQLELQEGTSGGEGWIYLTTNQLASGSALHFRFRQTEDDGLEGVSIMTGFGIKHQFHLSFIQ